MILTGCVPKFRDAQGQGNRHSAKKEQQKKKKKKKGKFRLIKAFKSYLRLTLCIATLKTVALDLSTAACACPCGLPSRFRAGISLFDLIWDKMDRVAICSRTTKFLLEAISRLSPHVTGLHCQHRKSGDLLQKCFQTDPPMPMPPERFPGSGACRGTNTTPPVLAYRRVLGVQQDPSISPNITCFLQTWRETSQKAQLPLSPPRLNFLGSFFFQVITTCSRTKLLQTRARRNGNGAGLRSACSLETGE